MTLRLLALAGALAIACAAASRALAQPLAGGGDITVAWPYTFRGEVMSTLPALEPRFWLAARFPAARVSLGASSVVEVFHPTALDFSLRGSGKSALAEWDVWLEATRTVFGQDVTLGATHYAFTGAATERVATSPYAEAYFVVERLANAPITESTYYRARYWHGILSAGTRYADLAVGQQWLIVPLPYNDISFSITGGAGINISRARPAARRPGTATKQGVTFYEVTPTVVAMPHCYEERDVRPHERLRDLLIPNQVSLRTQFGRDSVTRFVSRRRERARFSSLEVVWSPGQCSRSR